MQSINDKDYKIYPIIKFLLLLLILCSKELSYSQSISISQIDESQYPLIKVLLNVSDATAVSSSNFKIFEQGKEIAFTINNKPTTISNVRTNLFILYEISTTGTKDFPFKHAIISNLDILHENDYLNLAYFGTKNPSGEDIVILNPDFTNDKIFLKRQLMDLMPIQSDSSLQNRTNIYSNIFDALEYMDRITTTGKNRLIVIFSGKNYSVLSTNIDDCLLKAQKLNIPVNIIITKNIDSKISEQLYTLSVQSGGEFVRVEEGEIEKTLSELLEKSIKSSSNVQKNLYEIAFISSQSYKLNQFEIQFNEKKIRSTFTKPADEEDILMASLLWIVIFGFFTIIILLIIILLTHHFKLKKLFVLARKNDIKDVLKENEKLRFELEQRKNSTTKELPVFKDLDEAKTIIGTAGKIPLIIAESDQFSLSFELNKILITIGRNPENDIVIPDKTISGHHCTITNEGGIFHINDNSSTNGTFINDLKVTKSPITPNDLIRLGNIIIRIKY